MTKSRNGTEGAPFSQDLLEIDAAHEIERIAVELRRQVFDDLRRKGAVVGLSGGIDSSVTAAILVRALGPDRVLALLTPERESSADTVELGRCVASHLGIDALHHDITEALQAAGCYRLRDDAVRAVVPEFGPGWQCKLVFPNVLEGDERLRVFSIVVRSPDGSLLRKRLTLEAYRGVVAATNFKQRMRKMVEYYHADRLHFVVAGTPNRLEYDQGFFVKNGDGAADVKPIAHLFKTQVYQLGSELGLPERILRRPPTTDTYSLPQSQEEFYFSLPYAEMDLCLYGKNHGVPAEVVAQRCGLAPNQVERVFRDIDSKRRATRYQHRPPLLVEAVREIEE